MTVNEYNTSVDLYSDNLYRFILKHVKDRDVANDIVQDTYEKLWLKVNDTESTNAKSYMYTTAYRTMIDYTRRAKKQEGFDMDKHTDGFETKQVNSDLKAILNQALDTLPEIQKAVVLLRDYEGYEYREIAETTDLSESQVKVYIFRARQSLKNYIGNMEAVL
jgi:RNA polymerase sigma factor (sigma-70 family)